MSLTGTTVVRGIGQGLLIVLICAASAEVALRVFDTFVPTFIFYDDSYERYRGRHGEQDWGFPLNTLGFKDTEWGEATDDVYRIAGIGANASLELTLRADLGEKRYSTPHFDRPII